MKIESYKFGEMKVDGNVYRSDLIIFQNRIADSWWRKTGHNLNMDDLKDVIDTKPHYLFIGTGKYGLMRVSKDLRRYLHDLGIEVFVAKTDDSVKAYNKEQNSNKIGAFHLSC